MCMCVCVCVFQEVVKAIQYFCVFMSVKAKYVRRQYVHKHTHRHTHRHTHTIHTHAHARTHTRTHIHTRTHTHTHTHTHTLTHTQVVRLRCSFESGRPSMSSSADAWQVWRDAAAPSEQLTDNAAGPVCVGADVESRVGVVAKPAGGGASVCKHAEGRREEGRRAKGAREVEEEGEPKKGDVGMLIFESEDGELVGSLDMGVGGKGGADLWGGGKEAGCEGLSKTSDLGRISDQQDAMSEQWARGAEGGGKWFSGGASAVGLQELRSLGLPVQQPGVGASIDTEAMAELESKPGLVSLSERPIWSLQQQQEQQQEQEQQQQQRKQQRQRRHQQRRKGHGRLVGMVDAQARKWGMSVRLAAVECQR